MKKELIFAIFILVLMVNANAAPELLGAEGLVEDGQSLVITGSGFGFKENAAPLKWDDFEGGVAGDLIGNGWFVGTSYPPHYTNIGQRTGSILSSYSDDGTDDLLYTQDPTPLGVVYVTFWHKIERDCELGSCTGSNNKWLNLLDASWLTGGGGDSDPLFTLIEQWSYPSAMLNWRDTSGDEDLCDPEYAEIEIPCTTHIYQGTNYNDEYVRTNGTWERYELYATESVMGSKTGVVQFWDQHGGEGNPFVLLANHTDVDTISTNSDHWTGVDFGMMAQHSEQNWYDDIYIDNTQARIEIGDYPVFGDCTHREIQIPVEWSDGSITFDINQGSFSEGDSVYVFVIDAGGMTSEGLGPFIVGQETSFDGIAITSVSGLIDHGEVVTIGGLNFGATGPTIYKWDDFEGGTHIVGSPTGVGSTSGSQIAWRNCFPTGSDNPNPPIVSSSDNKEGSTKYMTVTFPSFWGGGIVMDYGEIIPSPIYISYYFNWNSTFPLSGSNHKPLTLLIAGYAEQPAPYYYTGPAISGGISQTDDSHAHRIMYDDYDSGTYEPWLEGTQVDPIPLQNHWTRGELYATESTPGVADGDVVWDVQRTTDGPFVNLWDYDKAAMTIHDPGDHWRASVFGRYGQPEGVFKYDDIYIANSRARLEIGNDPVFEDCTHREIQIPQSWSDGSITFTVNQGSFHDGDTVYVFVVDENGDASSGKEITFSGTYTGPCHEADTNEDGQLSVLEISAYINLWKIGQVSMSNLIDAIKIWKAQ